MTGPEVSTYALSLRQPWATLLVHGHKTIEVRRWQTDRRGRILIHAARGSDERPEAWRQVPPHLIDHARLGGGFVGQGELTGCIAYRTREDFARDCPRHRNAAEWFEPGLYGFLFQRLEVTPFQRYPGQMRFFQVELPAQPVPSLPDVPAGRKRRTVQLLVSVRSGEEATAALEGGADVIDVKEPSRGSLGRADDAVLAEVVGRVAGRCTVTAAMGELAENEAGPAVPGVTWIKWGLAGAGSEWRSVLQRRRHALTGPGLVAVAYADAERAGAPRVEEVCAFACAESLPVLLIDTWGKDGTTLLDWMRGVDVVAFCRRCHAAGVRVAVAGSLRQDQIELLRVLGPDFIAVRRAVCREGDRNGIVDSDRVRELARLLRAP